MICSNCGMECDYLFGTGMSDCCNEPTDIPIEKTEDCPCDSESPENCQSCRDKNTADNATKGLYSKEQIKDVLCSVGVSGYVRDLIMERFE